MTTGGPADLKVFVSSTSEDLKDYRAVVRNELVKMQWRPVMMEDFHANPTPTVQACRELLGDCDLMILIVAFRRGWVPREDQGGDGVTSVTGHELAHARAKNIPVLAFFAQPNWPGNLWEPTEQGRAWIEKFRAELNQIAVFFEWEKTTGNEYDRLPLFRATVRSELVAYSQKLPAKPAAGAIDFFAGARDGILDGTTIPFFGGGVYDDGPLSPAQLAKQLMGADGGGEVPSLATAAEFREQYLGDRPPFAQRFREIVVAQSANAATPRVYELLARAPKLPPLIVSATHDLVLERRLAQRQPIIVAHVVHSADGKYDGRILVKRPDKPAELCLADQIDLGDAKCVVYKPLGSPLLTHDDPDLEIDTVVVTESDHLTFLGRLANEHTRIPTTFTKFFRRPLVFLGYTLDLWQYRLVMQVFKAVGRKGNTKSLFSVRVPASTMEALAWTRIGVALVAMTPNDFAEKVLANLPNAQVA